MNVGDGLPVVLLPDSRREGLYISQRLQWYYNTIINFYDTK